MPAISMTPQEVSDYIAQAGRDAWVVPDVPADTPRRTIEKVGVIGAGTMGGGISMNFATAGIQVTILERQQEALDRGLGVVRGHYQRSADKGRFPVEEVDERMSRLIGTLSMEDFADCDLIIEAVFEDMDLKKQIFTDLDRIAKPGAILATNTSALDIDEIAS
ncbi:MAG: 3-hydroxyacyl-CoA dehydrogenase NAD-binding domain-containing protein, partial [Pseudomonadota bacterium]